MTVVGMVDNISTSSLFNKTALVISWDIYRLWYVLGILHRHVSAGKNLKVLVFTDDKENFSEAASLILGIRDISFFKGGDFSDFLDKKYKDFMREIIRTIRRDKPQFIVMEDPSRKGPFWLNFFNGIVQRACMEAAASIPKFLNEGEPYKVKAYYYWNPKEPNVVFDIVDTERKIKEFAEACPTFKHFIFEKRVALRRSPMILARFFSNQIME